MFIILSYDIADSAQNQNRTLKVFKLCKKYLFHLQRSVFWGELDKKTKKVFQMKLCSLIDFEKDSCVLFSLRNKNNLSIECLAKPEKIDAIIIG